MDSTQATVTALGLGAFAAVASLGIGYYLGRNVTHRSSELSGSQKEPKIIPVNDLQEGRYSQEERDARCSLAALYRAIDLLGWSEQIYNHISLRVPGSQEHFLINAYGLHYSEVTASNLVKVDIDGKIIDPGTTNLGINLSGYVIHSAIHRSRKDVKCILHVHTPVGVAISSLKSGLLPISMYSFAYNCAGVSYHDFQGWTTDDKEKKDIVNSLGPTNKVLILRNHGLITLGDTMESAYQLLRDLMTACESQLLALSAGVDNLVQFKPEELRESENCSSHGFKYGELEYECLMREMDRKGYKTGYKYKLGSYMKQ